MSETTDLYSEDTFLDEEADDDLEEDEVWTKPDRGGLWGAVGKSAFIDDEYYDRDAEQLRVDEWNERVEHARWIQDRVATLKKQYRKDKITKKQFKARKRRLDLVQ